MDKRIFLLTYNEAAGPREEIRELIDSLNFVVNWITWSENSFLLLKKGQQLGGFLMR
jgi:hypothetical protein